jgi:hypothetical protein
VGRGGIGKFDDVVGLSDGVCTAIEVFYDEGDGVAAGLGVEVGGIRIARGSRGIERVPKKPEPTGSSLALRDKVSGVGLIQDRGEDRKVRYGLGIDDDLALDRSGVCARGAYSVKGYGVFTGNRISVGRAKGRAGISIPKVPQEGIGKGTGISEGNGERWTACQGRATKIRNGTVGNGQGCFASGGVGAAASIGIHDSETNLVGSGKRIQDGSRIADGAASIP